jgi:DNA-binding transcriptional LysR family regulator
MATVEYNRVAQFVRVVSAGSFTAAAADLGLPKSSLSRSVSNLERDLGVRLLHRTTRKLTLTDLGHSYYESVRGAFETIDDAHERALEHDTQPRGVVRISGAPDFAWLAPVLVDLTHKYPGIELDVRLTTRYVDLLAEGIDIAVRAGRLQDSTLVARKVGSTELGLLASPTYLDKRGRPAIVADLPNHDWILFRANNHHASLTLTGPDGDVAVSVTGSLVVDDMAFCRSACEAGGGIARLPLTALMDGKLERVLPGYHAGGGQLWLVLPTSQFVPRRVALVRDFLAERLPLVMPQSP